MLAMRSDVYLQSFRDFLNNLAIEKRFLICIVIWIFVLLGTTTLCNEYRIYLLSDLDLFLIKALFVNVMADTTQTEDIAHSWIRNHPEMLYDSASGTLICTRCATTLKAKKSIVNAHLKTRKHRQMDTEAPNEFYFDLVVLSTMLRTTSKFSMSCQVKVNQGLLQGKVCESYFGQTFYSFEGIPYAKPPIGKLRFRAPQEPESWSGVRDATKPGKKCAQINPYGNQTLEGSEDCLYLNVYTPKLSKNETDKLPVLFFVHGGRLIVGYGDYYRPDFLIRHNVILVTINYRLHILGFLCLHTPEIPGNAGVKDTVMALKWVKRNIQYFNGDPDNITVFGESAGAGIVSSYLTSNMTDGLFNKMIVQSGNLLSDLYLVEEDEEKKARNVAQIMGKSITDPRNLSDYLTEAPLEDLVNAFVIAELSRQISVINAYFLPVVEKEFKGVERFFFESPHVSFKNNRFKKLPILITLCSHEGAMFLPRDSDGNIIFEDNFQYFIPRYLSIGLDNLRASKFADRLKRFYFKGNNLEKSDKTAYLEFISDVYFARDTMLFVEKVSRHMNIYTCLFSFDGRMNTSTMKKLGVKGASHGDLVQYLFYRENKIKHYKAEEKKVVDVLTEGWCNFAKTGKPFWKDQLQEWLPYTPEKKLCLHVDKEITLIPYPKFEKYQFWFDLMKEQSKL